jgi:hypothetical protein
MGDWGLRQHLTLAGSGVPDDKVDALAGDVEEDAAVAAVVDAPAGVMVGTKRGTVLKLVVNCSWRKPSRGGARWKVR